MNSVEMKRYGIGGRANHGGVLSGGSARLALMAACSALAYVAATSGAQAACTAVPCLENLGTLGGISSGLAVNADGSVVVGQTNIGDPVNHAYRWTSAGGMQDLGIISGPGFFSTATAVNADGSVVVGSASAIDELTTRPFRWTSSSNTMEDLGTLGGNFGSAYGVSADGSVVVGQSTLVGDLTTHAFRFVEGGTIEDLHSSVSLGGTNSYAYGISADGSVIVGGADVDATVSHAFRWTQIGGVRDLGDLAGGSGYSVANAVSADGNTVVGFSEFSGGGYRAFSWTNSTDMVNLGSLGGDSFANSVNGDGSIVVGSSNVSPLVSHAFRWTSATGMVDLNTSLSGAGVDMTGITLVAAYGISANGEVIVGTGDFGAGNRAFIVRYGEGTPTGVTTTESVQQSIDKLASTHTQTMAQQHGLVAPLLGENQPMGDGSEIGLFASAGSMEAGGHFRYGAGNGWSVLGGIAYANETYASAKLDDSFVGALALRYVHDNAGAWHLFAEAGGWYGPEAKLAYSRSYMNGAGTAVGTGNTKGDMSYYFGRAGLLIADASTSQVALSVEYGRQQLHLNGYTEQDSAQNPFPAVISGGDDAMNVVKARAQVSHRFSERFDATVWGAAVHGFDRSTDLTGTVFALGALTPADLKAVSWAEYGVRFGYQIARNATLDVFANGVSGADGTDGIGTEVHAGAGLRLQF
jgi:probable HAF family extracellular repeat protein